jgi:hypothetical protein
MENQNNNTLPFEQAKAEQAATVTAPAAEAQPANVPAVQGEQSLTVVPSVPVFADKQVFEHAQRVAKMMTASSLVPKEYQNNIPNIMIALEMANRIGASPLMVMQNLNIIQGRPSWSSQFIIAALNSCKRFSPLRFTMSGEGDDYGCTAWATDATGEKLEGPKVSWKMAKEEGWATKGGSKWKTMPELMFRYRAAAFFGRLYAPDVLMGMGDVGEAEDIAANEMQTAEQKANNMNNALKALQ